MHDKCFELKGAIIKYGKVDAGVAAHIHDKHPHAKILEGPCHGKELRHGKTPHGNVTWSVHAWICIVDIWFHRK